MFTSLHAGYVRVDLQAYVKSLSYQNTGQWGREQILNIESNPPKAGTSLLALNCSWHILVKPTHLDISDGWAEAILLFQDIDGLQVTKVGRRGVR